LSSQLAMFRYHNLPLPFKGRVGVGMGENGGLSVIRIEFGDSGCVGNVAEKWQKMPQPDGGLAVNGDGETDFFAEIGFFR